MLGLGGGRTTPTTKPSQPCTHQTKQQLTKPNLTIPSSITIINAIQHTTTLATAGARTPPIYVVRIGYVGCIGCTVVIKLGEFRFGCVDWLWRRPINANNQTKPTQHKPNQNQSAKLNLTSPSLITHIHTVKHNNQHNNPHTTWSHTSTNILCEACVVGVGLVVWW